MASTGEACLGDGAAAGLKQGAQEGNVAAACGDMGGREAVAVGSLHQVGGGAAGPLQQHHCNVLPACHCRGHQRRPAVPIQLRVLHSPKKIHHLEHLIFDFVTDKFILHGSCLLGIKEVLSFSDKYEA